MLSNHPIMVWLAKNRGILFPAAAASLIFVILIPLPTTALDFMLIANIVLTTVVLMTVMYLHKPLEFSSFPSMLLAMTLLRLVLNTATTRLILSNGSQGPQAAGRVVEAFGIFVAGNSLAVGVIIFLIITIIQFVVITKGATRIAEVAARFTLDGMPGKQMAIDADLNAGVINEAEAKHRREEISREADFYGAMDGASKFVRGDAIAGIIITIVNVLGGIYVGMIEGGMGLLDSLNVYTKLTIGDGLASQIPAFTLSVAAGMLVTRSTGRTNMGEEVLTQLLAKPVALIMAAGFMLVLTLTPLPTIPLMTMATGCGVTAYFLRKTAQTQTAKKIAQQRQTELAKPDRIESHLGVDPLELQIGLGLVRIVDKQRGGDLLDRISSMRKQTAVESGLVVPPVRIRDNTNLPSDGYAVMLRGQEIARGTLQAEMMLAIDSGLASEPLSGIETTEPAFGLKAWWINPDQRDRAERLNYTVVAPTGVLATHLTEIIKQHAAELLTRTETNKLLDNVKQNNAALVEEVIPDQLKVGEVQAVLQNLLRERVSIRDLETILETLGDWAGKTKDVEILTEYARNALARSICAQYKDDTGVIHCVTLDPTTEDYIQGNIQRLEHGSTLAIPPDKQAALAQKIREAVEQTSHAGAVVVLCAPQARLWMRRLIEPVLPQVGVLGLNEIVKGIEVQAHGVISFDATNANIPSPVHA